MIMDKKKNITREYVIKGQESEIQCVLFRRKCKTLRIAVTPDLKIKITAPLRASESFINEAVREKTPWILRTLHRLKNCRELPVPEKYEAGEKLAYLGNEYILKVIHGKRSPARLEGNFLVVQLPEPDIKSVKREVDKWLRIEAEKIFGAFLNSGFYSVSQYYSVKKPSLKIRRMKSRWGTCSRSGEITLNLMLIHLPPVCIEYIIMHEICHLKHMNHSKAFYSFFQHCLPDWKERKAILESYRMI